MGQHLQITFALLLGIAVSAPAQQSLAGSWRGHWFRMGDTMPVILEVRQDSSDRYSASFSADRLRVMGIPFTALRVEGCCDITMVLRGDRTTATFSGVVSGDSLTGTLTEEGAGPGRFAYSRFSATETAVEEREISIANGPVTLAGSLLLPRSRDRVPVVVFLHGSGGEGRWASRFLATQLVRAGIGALIFDKRGVGRSTGDWRTATPDDLAADGAAAVARLRQEPGVDPRRIGLHGHSQGGTLAPLVAARAPGVAFVIGSAAAGVPTDSTELFSLLNFAYPSAESAADSMNAHEYANEVVAVAYHQRPRARLDSLAAALRGRPWFFAPPPPDASYWAFSKAFGQYDALAWWARVRVPVLLVYGEQDRRVQAAESARRIASALRNANNMDVTVRIFPGADHTFRLPPGPSGWPVSPPDYVSTLVSWVRARALTQR
jgi:uncharacterized protein